MYYCKPLVRNILGQKQCNVCKQWKDETNFGKNKTKPDGLQAACLICQREQVRKSKEKNRKTPPYVAQALIRNELGQKQCSKCKRWLDEIEFCRKVNSKDGLNFTCRSCQQKYDKARSVERKEKYSKIIEQRKLANQRFNDKGELLQQCSKCKEYKVLSIDNFALAKLNSNGYSAVCRDCRKIEQIQYKESLSPEEKERQRLYKLEYMRKYREEHREEINKKKLKKNLSQMQILSHTLSSAIYRVLKGMKSERHWEDLIDYSIQDLKEHLESQFTPKMSWDNIGEYWEVDHIVPLNLFHYETEQDEQFKICWSLANLRPLEKIANKSRPKDGRDIPEEVKNKILGQNFRLGRMGVENKEESE